MNWYQTGPASPYREDRRPPAAETPLERLAVLENEVSHLGAAIGQERRDREDLADRLSTLEHKGQEAIAGLPSAMAEHTRPLEARLEKLELGWWHYLQPHMPKVYAIVALAIGSRLWKAVTGVPLDIKTLMELAGFLKG